jgi:hypothetical protein
MADPDNLVSTGPVGSSVLTVSVPALLPVTVGLKVDERVQEAPAANRPPHGLDPLALAAKSGLVARLVMVVPAPPVLVIVIVFLLLVAPTATLAKDKVAGEKANVGSDPPAGVPCSATSTGPKPALFVTAKTP